MNQSSRYLTKSRFKLAVECPRKLYYTGKRGYVDRSIEDSFLAALAEGGYQVGELACLIHTGGIRIDDLDHQIALDKTAELLRQDEVTIEAAIAVGNLFVRVDVLRKSGARIEIIEVKAKSYSAKKDSDFWAAAGFKDTLLRWKKKPEVVHGEKKDIQPRVQARGGQAGH